MHHSNLKIEKWQRLTLYEQMGNIGSEVRRAFRAKGKDEKSFNNAVERTLELIDLTVADPKRKHHLKEILRAREVFCDAISGRGQYKSSLSDVDRYFMQFAMAARLKK